jgi:hypothetical protein
MINQKRYVNIVSGVGAGVNVGARQLILRIMTQNPALSPGIVAEFPNADSVGNFFTMQSEEYKRALAYFSFISKSVKSPQLISFARWISTAIAPMVVGDALPKKLADFTPISAGTLDIKIGAAAPINIPAINLSTAVSLTDVASKVQTAIRLNVAPQLANATVTYNTNTNQFVFTGSVTGSGTIIFVPGAANDISGMLGLSTAGSVQADGQAADTAAQAVAKSADISNNFGSFVFATPSTALTNQNIVDIAAWNHGQNNMYIYSLAALMADAAALSPLLIGYSGCSLNIKSTVTPDDFVEQSPCEILAATDYNSVNATQNYMYYQFGARHSTVNTDTLADQMDALRANYIGTTQSAGQNLSFYQRGLLMGDGTAAVDTNTYANEIWLKSDIAAGILTMFLALPAVPADDEGRAIVLGVLQKSINKGKDNGTISSGKAIDNIKQQYITRLSGDPLAWRQVQNIGFWVNVSFSSYVNSNTHLVEWKASYTLIYSKDDQIRFVEGQDIMI